ncbi:hypothetical protein HPB50_012374 [Hyalomma asiaticum]|uniref:Uncharacterized protein n=1 Tax=Hyalomma asiaticum TaxID=266040 RepID=A0ACB7TGN3_HYAAI|nr:hypothetical protein HPB50_012374 [Hyalomma asiaticum]
MADFYRQLNPLFLERKHLILIGDINCVLNNLADRTGPARERKDPYTSELRKLVEQFNLTDAYVLHHGETFQSTWAGNNTQARLDRVYVSSSIKSLVLHCQAFHPSSFALGVSDHRPVLVTFQLEDRSRICLPWRVDNRLFNDETAKASLRKRLAASLGKHNWDGLKQEWKEICTDEGKKLKHHYSDLVRATLQRIRIVERGKPTTLLMKT